MPTTIRFKQQMKGFVSPGATDCDAGFARGKEERGSIKLDLTITIPDLDFFKRDPLHKGNAEGSVTCEVLGGDLQVNAAWFQCLADHSVGNNRCVRFVLQCSTNGGRLLTLYNEATVLHGEMVLAWQETTTFNVKVFEGHVDQETPGLTIIAAGRQHVGPIQFTMLLASIQAEAPTLLERKRGIAEFGNYFLGSLWQTYGPRVGGVRKDDSERLVPLFTLEGVRQAEISTHYFSTPDNLGLSLFRFQREPSDDVVLLLHGLTNSTDMFIMPEHYNLVNYLHDHGFGDVWSLDWRGSMRFNYDLFPTNFSIDDTALYDIPAALAKIRSIAGEGKRVHVICHCLGSVAFMMALYAGLVDGITSVCTNSVSLTPRVPRWSYIKLCLAPFLMHWILRYPHMNPRWAAQPGPGVPQGKLLAKFISLFHRECDVDACHMLSFMWGAGFPGIYRHENLDDLTHRRLGDLFGSININYYLQVRKMARYQLTVKLRPNDPRYDRLPNNYLEGAPKVTTPILFVTGEMNRVFLDSNVRSYEILAKINPEHQNELKTFPGYGHQDPFMGKNSHIDVFPFFVDFMQRARGRQETSEARAAAQ